ncbi:MAG: Flp pilus assembly protein CpaB [Planctomycetota bacterium]|nr:Flp pilus assembly protein CpaB [Planctomycetota bacterium]
MRAKSVLLIVIALGCGVVASVAVSQVVLDQNNRAVVQTAPVLVVAKEILAATKIPTDGFRLEQWPIDRIPVGALSDPKMIENKFTKQRFYPGEPIIEAKLSAKGREFTVPDGYQIFDILVKEESGGGGYIGPGDHVDVYGYMDKVTRVKGSKSVKVMENLEVVMIDGVAFAESDATKQKKPSTIQLLVKDSQYIVLDTASNLGKLRLALRPSGKQETNIESDDGGKFLAWLNEPEETPSQKPTPEPIEELIAVIPEPEKPEKHEMVIVSSTKTTLYRFNEGQRLPQKFDGDQSPDAADSVTAPQGRHQNGSLPNFQPTIKPKVPNQASSAEASPPNRLIGPVNPPNVPQSNLTWDPGSGSWQSGGFKATYPNGN